MHDLAAPFELETPRTVATPEPGVECRVDGVPVRFASQDHPLSPAPEAFASAFLPVALQLGRRLVSEAPLDPVWLEGAGRIVERFHAWWGLPRLLPRSAAPGNRASVAAPEHAGALAAGSRGLCFSLGVDSSYSLLRHGGGADVLITAHGFDYPPDGATRREAVVRAVREVAGATGKTTAFVSTDLRRHPASARTNWEVNHGGALAALGHLLAPRLEELLISSSFPRVMARPWGSHLEVDRWYSSDRLRVRTVGDELARADKLRRICHEPWVREHLRVCWANTTASGNCSRCDKCVRTRVVLADEGVLDDFPVFAGTASLADDIHALPGTKVQRAQSLLQALSHRRLPAPMRSAIAGHLRRHRPELLPWTTRAEWAVRDWFAGRRGDDAR